MREIRCGSVAVRGTEERKLVGKESIVGDCAEEAESKNYSWSGGGASLRLCVLRRGSRA